MSPIYDYQVLNLTLCKSLKIRPSWKIFPTLNEPNSKINIWFLGRPRWDFCKVRKSIKLSRSIITIERMKHKTLMLFVRLLDPDNVITSWFHWKPTFFYYSTNIYSRYVLRDHEVLLFSQMSILDNVHQIMTLSNINLT